MKLENQLQDEKGYLLIENLITLSVILTILVILYPLIVQWLVIREEAKQSIENSRVLYESSVLWPTEIQEREGYTIESTDYSIFVKYHDVRVGVDIYAMQFSE